MTVATITNAATRTARRSRVEPLWLAYLVLGVAFGTVLTKSEVISWFRIQEMHFFQSVYSRAENTAATLTVVRQTMRDGL